MTPSLPALRASRTTALVSLRRSLSLAALAVAVTASAALAVDAFKGSWKMKLEPEPDSQSAGARAMDDTVVFKGDNLVAAKLTAKGWPPAKCDTDTRGGMGLATFTATAKHKSEGTMKWTGSITGSEMKGTMIWTKADGTELRYEFTGSRE
jgi:hypothetical protein